MVHDFEGLPVFRLASYKKHTLKLTFIDFQVSNRETELKLTTRNAPQLIRSPRSEAPLKRNRLELPPTGNSEQARNSCPELQVLAQGPSTNAIQMEDSVSV